MASVYDSSNLSSSEADCVAKMTATTQGLLLLDSHDQEPDYIKKKAHMTARLGLLTAELAVWQA